MSKLTKEELRKPDQVWQASAKSYHFLKDQWVLGLILVAALFLGLFGYFYLNQLQKAEEAKAQHELAELIKIYEQQQVEPSETFATEFNQKLESLKSDYADSRAQAYGQLFEARVLFRDGKTEEALSGIQAFEKALPRSHRAVALYPLAIAYEELGSWSEAVRVYDQVIGLGDKASSYRKWAFMGKARSLRELGNSAEAVAVYDQILSEFPQSPELPQIRGLKMLALSLRESQPSE